MAGRTAQRGTTDTDTEQVEVQVPAEDEVAARADDTTEGTTADERAAAVGKTRSVNARPARIALDSDETPRTLLDDNAAMPGYVAPGDGPFDTVDPSEHATSVSPDKGAAAREGFGVVNAVLPIADPSGREQAMAKAAQERGASEGRMETYSQVAPNGQPVQVEHNLDTGETKVVG